MSAEKDKGKTGLSMTKKEWKGKNKKKLSWSIHTETIWEQECTKE